MLPDTGRPAAVATSSLMLVMTWSAIVAVLSGFSENSSAPVRVSVTPTSGPSCKPFSSRSCMAEPASGRARVVTSTPNSVRCHRHSKSGVSLLIRSSTPARASFTPTSSSARCSSSWSIPISCRCNDDSFPVFAIWPCCLNAVRLSASPGGAATSRSVISAARPSQKNGGTHGSCSR
jgi:hypothetical protein